MVNIGSPGLVNKGSQMHWFNVGSSLIIIKLRISRLGFLMNHTLYNCWIQIRIITLGFTQYIWRKILFFPVLNIRKIKLQTLNFRFTMTGAIHSCAKISLNFLFNDITQTPPGLKVYVLNQKTINIEGLDNWKTINYGIKN